MPLPNTNNIIILNSEPGIQKDGTRFKSKSYIDGQWVRFYDGTPLKIAGYRIIDFGTDTIIRTIFNFDNQKRPNSVDVYLGRLNFVGYVNFNFNGVISVPGEIDRTPTGYVSNVSNLWDFDVFIKTDTPNNPLIVAHVAPNANDVTNTVEGPVYYGNTGDNLSLTPVLEPDGITPVMASGGIVYAPPILIAYGNGGLITFCNPGALSGIDSGWDENFQTIANTKIIKILLTRGSAAPQLLAWTNSSIISLTYTFLPAAPDKAVFTAITLDTKITVMSPNSIVGYANQFFWIGLNQFYFFNGIVQPLPNTMNSQFFFQSINLPHRAKVWGEIVNPGTGGTEIWWHAPLITPTNLDPTECTHTIIYFVELKRWGDSIISRAAGVGAGIFPVPIMSDNVLNPNTNTYPLWMHETGIDKVTALPTNPETPIPPGQIHAIDAYCESHIYDFFETNPNNNRAMRIRRIEPDFRMAGHMTVTVNNRFFPSDTIANGRVIQSGPYTFDLDTQKIDDLSSQGRLSSFRFESNEIGGTFHMGKPLLTYGIGDVHSSIAVSP
jgi:hypothetical protein